MRLARGFTLVDLIAVLAVSVLIVAIALPVITLIALANRRSKDSTQIRTIHQALIISPQNSSDDYPLPSRLDKWSTTVPEEEAAKNTTANIYSWMIWHGLVAPELLISPLEINPNVRACGGYQYTSPTGAVDPSKALWDPKFSVFLDGSRPGNASYAHAQPCGVRRRAWSNTFTAEEPAIGTRGPEIDSVMQNPDGSVTPTLANPKSNTLRFFGKSKSWSGNMDFNDNHVEFLKDWLKPGEPYRRDRTYTAADGKQRPDLWCHDEADDPKAANDYLGIFLKAGAEPKDFKAAWD